MRLVPEPLPVPPPAQHIAYADCAHYISTVLCLAKTPDASMSKMLHERLIAVVRLRDGIFGKYVKVRVLREVLEAVSERSLATLAERPSLAKHLN